MEFLIPLGIILVILVFAIKKLKPKLLSEIVAKFKS
jgi:hypothetical protein